MLPIVTVVCDDTKTAVAYFTELKRNVKTDVTLNAVPAPCDGACPAEMVEFAAKFTRSLVPRSKRDSVWVLLDMEAEAHKQRQAKQAQEQAEQESRVQVLLSKPCFEVWTLAHFVDTGEDFKDCDAVVARVKSEWKKKFGSCFGNKKGQADYAKLMPLRAEAVKNAKKRNAIRDPSWTEVYKAVEAIMLLCRD